MRSNDKVKASALVLLALFSLLGEYPLLSAASSAQLPTHLLKAFTHARGTEISLCNDYLCLYVETSAEDGIGTFTLETREGDDLLFAQDGAWSSYLTIQVDGVSYANRKEYTPSLNNYVEQNPTVVGNSIVTKWRLPGPLLVTQEIKLSGRAAVFTVTVENKGNTAKSVKARYLFDYQVKDQDGSPIYIEGVGVIVKETVFTRVNMSFNRWYTRDYHDSTYTMQGVHTMGTPPYMIVFANWSRAFQYPYDYPVQPGARFYTPGKTKSPESDSCALLYWDLGILQAGESRQLWTAYGLAEPELPSTERLKIALEEYNAATLQALDSYSWKLAKIVAQTYKHLKDLGKDDTLDAALTALGSAVGIEKLIEGDPTSLISKGILEILKYKIKVANKDQVLSSYTTLKYLYEHIEKNARRSNIEELTKIIYNKLWDENSTYLISVYDVESNDWKKLRLIEIKRSIEERFSKLINSLPQTLPENYPLENVIECIKYTTESIRRAVNSESVVPYVNSDLLVNEFLLIGSLNYIYDSVEKYSEAFIKAEKEVKIYGLIFSTIISAGLVAFKILSAIKTVGISLAIEFFSHTILLYTPFGLASFATNTVGDRFIAVLSLVALIAAAPADLGSLLKQHTCTIRFVKETLQNPDAWVRSIASGEVAVLNTEGSVPEGESAGKARLVAKVKSKATSDVRIQASLAAYAPPKSGMPKMSFKTLEKPMQVSAGGELEFALEATVPGVEALGEVDAYLGELWVSLSWNKVIKVSNLMFRVASPAAQEVMNKLQTKKVMEGSLSQGESAESRLEVSEQTAETRLILTYSGSDFDLHLYDETGRHVGLNYEKGTIDAEIPGVLYSGPQAYPEWMVINTTSVKRFKVKVVCTSATGREGFTVLSTEVPRLPPQIAAIPSSLKLTVAKGRQKNTTILLSEYGGFSGAKVNEVKVSSFRGNGAELPATTVSASPSSSFVQPSSYLSLCLSIKVPSDARTGTYTGTVTVKTDAGDITVKVELNVIPFGDVNLDGEVNYKDLAIIVSRYGAALADPEYTPYADLNDDFNIDYKDLAVVTSHYGEGERAAGADPLESYTSFSLKFSLLAGLGEKNTAVSPFSVYPAMLMLSEGAAGETKAEILRALGLSSQAEAREWFRSSAQKLLSAQPPAKTSIANSLWVKEDAPVKSSYAEVLARYYLAEHHSFASLSEAVQRINSWVSEKTNKLIEKIIEEEHLDPRTVVVLVNTIYFKANWTTPFERVVRDTFNSPDGPVEAEYLSGTVSAKVYEGEEFVAVALSYNGTGVKFVALMPKRQTLREFLGNISERELLGILSELLSRDDERVKLLLPKFDVDSDILKLKPILESMGVRKVFNPMQADLSEMLDAQAYVGDVFHRARVRVDLYGTEAAAATAVVIPFIAPPSQVRFVKIDKPFAFFLVDPDTKAALFAGSFVKP